MNKAKEVRIISPKNIKSFMNQELLNLPNNKKSKLSIIYIYKLIYRILKIIEYVNEANNTYRNIKIK